MFSDFSFLGRESLIAKERLSEYKGGLCPNAEIIQPKILAFKTNYWDWSKAEKQVEILKNTISFLKTYGSPALSNRQYNSKGVQ